MPAIRADPAMHPKAATAAGIMRTTLEDGAQSLGLSLATIQFDRLLDYLQALERWNRVYNLTSVRDPSDMLVVHVLDSLSMVELVRAAPEGSVLDVGSGAGLPGVPLAIAIPDRSFDLVDAVAKKTSFLTQMKSTLGLRNVQPHHGRIEAFTSECRPSVIVSRAYADLSTMVRSIEHLAGDETRVLAMKGVLPTEEIAQLPVSWRVVGVHPLEVPGLGAERCAIELQRALPSGD